MQLKGYMQGLSSCKGLAFSLQAAEDAKKKKAARKR